jgi:predicted membrane channel-forming protein YqfA (hemolysin III family)
MDKIRIVFSILGLTWIIPLFGIILFIKFKLAPEWYKSDPGLFWVIGAIIVFFRVQWLNEKSRKFRFR